MRIDDTRIASTPGMAFDMIARMLTESKPEAVGVAMAFVSPAGARQLAAWTREFSIDEVRVVAGTYGAVTSPKALRTLLESKCSVRLGAKAPVFHPKLLIGAERFQAEEIFAPRCAYFGSSNLSAGGLHRNVELGVCTTDGEVLDSLGAAFQEYWRAAYNCTEAVLADYEREFTRRQAQRSREDLIEFEVTGPEDESGVLPEFASSAWAGLQSFTGEHTFQVEFPVNAGIALLSILGKKEGEIDILCSDGIARRMIYRYYDDNGMYRLNVPNDVPGVTRAREHREGALVVEIAEGAEGSHIRTNIVFDEQAEELIAKSRLLGTLGETATRYYGWN